MNIKYGYILNDEFNFVKTDITIKGELIEKLGYAERCDIDATDCYVIPGFVDTHFHGAVGEDFIDYRAGTFEKISKYMAKFGTTTIVPTLSAAPKEKMMGAVKYLMNFKNEKEECASMMGIHLEGPFFSEVYKGAHLPENIRKPNIGEFEEYIKVSEGFIKIITMAPELEGADELIRYATEKGVCVSVGHTNATMEEVQHADEVGAKQCTHLFNAMRGLNHREPGTVGGVLFSDLKAELICDFYHVHPEVIKMVYLLKGVDKINLVTDSVFGNGLSDGEFINNGRRIILKNGRSYTEDGTISGSTICLIDAVRNLVSIGIPLEKACMMASKNPALSIGEYDTVGSVKVGKRADIVILDKRLNIKNVILRGKIIGV